MAGMSDEQHQAYLRLLQDSLEGAGIPNIQVNPNHALNLTISDGEDDDEVPVDTELPLKGLNSRLFPVHEYSDDDDIDDHIEYERLPTPVEQFQADQGRELAEYIHQDTYREGEIEADTTESEYGDWNVESTDNMESFYVRKPIPAPIIAWQPGDPPMTLNQFHRMAYFVNKSSTARSDDYFRIRMMGEIIRNMSNRRHLSRHHICRLLFQYGSLFYLKEQNGFYRYHELLGTDYGPSVAAEFNPQTVDSPDPFIAFYVAGTPITKLALEIAKTSQRELKDVVFGFYDLLCDLYNQEGIPFNISINYLLFGRDHQWISSWNAAGFTQPSTFGEYRLAGIIPAIGQILTMTPAISDILRFPGREDQQLGSHLAHYFTKHPNPRVAMFRQHYPQNITMQQLGRLKKWDLDRKFLIDTDSIATWTRDTLAMSYNDFWQLRPFSYWSDEKVHSLMNIVMRVRKLIARVKNITPVEFCKLVFRNGALLIYSRRGRKSDFSKLPGAKKEKDGSVVYQGIRFPATLQKLMAEIDDQTFMDFLRIYKVLGQLSRYECLPFSLGLNYLILAPMSPDLPSRSNLITDWTFQFWDRDPFLPFVSDAMNDNTNLPIRFQVNRFDAYPLPPMQPTLVAPPLPSFLPPPSSPPWVNLADENQKIRRENAEVRLFQTVPTVEIAAENKRKESDKTSAPNVTGGVSFPSSSFPSSSFPVTPLARRRRLQQEESDDVITKEDYDYAGMKDYSGKSWTYGLPTRPTSYVRNESLQSNDILTSSSSTPPAPILGSAGIRPLFSQHHTNPFVSDPSSSSSSTTPQPQARPASLTARSRLLNPTSSKK